MPLSQPNLAYSELEEPELEPLVPLAVLEALDELVELALEEEESELELPEGLLEPPPDDELYKSEYQPPPLRMNPPLREI